MQEETDLDTGKPRRCNFINVDVFHNALYLGSGFFANALRSVDESAEEHRKKHKMVILHPNHGSRLELRKDGLGKGHIRLPVSLPVKLVKVHLSRVVVEQGPEDGI